MGWHATANEPPTEPLDRCALLCRQRIQRGARHRDNAGAACRAQLEHVARERGELFGDDDERDSGALRRAATRAAEAGDFATAIAEMFRALARGLSERTIVTTSPGTTAHGFVRQAATAFPDAAARLASAADDFDRVRYLGVTGTAEQWQAMSALERELRSATPAHDDHAAAVMW